VLVLGTIFCGLASPTEAAGIGAMGSIVLAVANRKFTLAVLRKTLYETAHVTSMVFFILLGATTFALVFRGMGGDMYLTNLVTGSVTSPTLFLLLVMILLFVAGFFIDFIEIIFIFVPVLMPLFQSYNMDIVWVAILLALNLQTSFLTPPFGFALFYLRGVAPAAVRTQDMYRGVIPFLLIQLFVLFIVAMWPNILHIW
jgi:tripartite ATP-independent transporter DctM subunit